VSLPLQCAANHGIVYTGPTWVRELEAARAVLAVPEVPPEPVAWWNGLRHYDPADHHGPSFSEDEDTWHDIPVYSGMNPAAAPQGVPQAPAAWTQEQVDQARELGKKMLEGTKSKPLAPDDSLGVPASPSGSAIAFTRVLTGAVMNRLFHELQPIDQCETPEEVDAWWKHYAAKVRLELVRGTRPDESAPIVTPQGAAEQENRHLRLADYRRASELLRLAAAPKGEPQEVPAALACGHPASLMLVSAETGAPLYCELCDAQSGRRDAEKREQELMAEVDEMRAQLRHLVDDLTHCPNPDEPTRRCIKPSPGLTFSNMVNAVARLLAAPRTPRGDSTDGADHG
jgi:hypothetical protein